MKLRITIWIALVSAGFLSCQPPATAQVHWASPDAWAPSGFSPADGLAYVAPAGAFEPVIEDASYYGVDEPFGQSCPPGCACGGSHFGQPSRIWGQADYLLWWSQTRSIPPLVTTSPQGTPPETAGRLGAPTTTILLGNDQVGGDAQSGFRIDLGFWLDRQQTVGVGGRYFVVGDDDDVFARSSDGDPVLARPFFNVQLGQQDALLVAYPGISTGGVRMTTSNKAQGSDVFLRLLLHSAYGNRLDLIGGYQFTRLDDAVIATDSLSPQDPGVPPGSVINTRDSFETQNDFHGGFVGFMGLAEDGRFTWRMLAKVAFGNMNQQASISGRTVASVPSGAESTRDFGLLALPSNIGTQQQNEFAIVPELNVSVAYKLTNQVELAIGYSFIHWSQVVLAGDTIDLRINPSQIEGPLVGPALPALELDSDGFWYQGLNLGGVWRF